MRYGIRPIQPDAVSARQLAAIGATGQRSGSAPQEVSGLFGDLTEKLRAPEKAGKEFENTLFRTFRIGPEEARERMRDDPTVLISQVLDKLKSLPDAARQRVAERLLGPEQGERLSKFANQVDLLRRNYELVENVAQRSGAVQKLFDTFDEITRAKVDKMGASFDVLAVKLGSKLLPAIRASADGLAHMFDGLSSYIDTSDQAETILKKQEEGKALTPDEQKGVDHNPKLRSFLGMDPDPAATAAKREGDRQKALKTIQDLDRSARETQDPQIRGMVDDARKDYRSTYSERPAGEESGAIPPAGDAVARPEPDKHAAMVELSMIHRAAFFEGGDDRAVAGRAPTDDMRGVLAGATKDGVVAGLREFALMGGTAAAAGGVVAASWETGDGASGSDGGEGGGSHRGGTGARNMRYGRAPRAAALPSMRYGRAGTGYRETPGGHAGRADAHPAYRHTPGHGGDGVAGVPDADFQTKGNVIDGLTEAGTRQYAAVLGKRESGNRYGITNQYGFVGRWQMGAAALAENGYVKKGTTNRGLNDPNNWTGKGDIHSVEEFKANKGGVQDREFAEYTNRHYAQLKKAGVIRDGMSQADVAGWLAAAHLKGVGGATQLARGHENVDANGTSASSYKRMMAGVGRDAPSPGLAARARPPMAAGTDATVSPRFSNPNMKLAPRPDAGMTSASAGGSGAQVAQGPAPVQHFYGMHDPAQTARMAMLESNREVRRSQAPALHSVGRMA